MKYTLIILFIINTLTCFSQTTVDFKYYETDEEIYDRLFTHGEVNVNQIYSFSLLKYKKDSITIQSVKVNDSSFVTSLSRIHENKKLAFEAKIYSYTKLYNNEYHYSYYTPNELIKTYYPNGNIRSNEIYMYIDTDKLFLNQAVFFDVKSNIVEVNTLFGEDTIRGTFLADIINDSIRVYAKYNAGELQYSFYAESAYRINPKKWLIYKIVDEKTNEAYTTKKGIHKITRKLTFVYFCRHLIISDKKDLYFNEPIKYEYIKYRAANG